jgi:predicted nucleotidyltransferase
LLPQGVQLRVASIPALALLKVTAWHHRRHTHPGRDAPDLLLYLRSYLDCGNPDRATSEHNGPLSGDDFDYQAASARLLARDVVELLDQAAIRRVLQILSPEAEEDGPLLLGQQSGIDLEAARRLVQVF